MLEHLRVVELGDSLATAFAGRLFALAGADVVRLEPPQGDPLTGRDPASPAEERALAFYLRAGKRCRPLASGVTPAEALAACEGADVVLCSFTAGQLQSLGQSREGLAAALPALWCSVTPFGFEGPRAGWRATDLTAYASGGQMWVTGDADAEPLLAAGHQAYYQAGLHAFSASCATLVARKPGDAGEWLDISVQECQASALEGAGPAALVDHVDAFRGGNLPTPIIGIYPASDGWVSLAAMQRQLPALFRCIDRPEFAEDERFSTVERRRAHEELVMAAIAEWSTSHTVDEIFAAATKHGAPFTKILDVEDVLGWDGLVEQGFWQPVLDPVSGRTVRMPASAIAVDGKRGVTGGPRDEAGGGPCWPDVSRPATVPRALGVTPPLAGVRVLDLTAVWSGPVGCRFLADMGAEVIKVEGPRTPDPTRFLKRHPTHPEPWNAVAYTNEYNRNKEGISLDLALPRGRELFLELVAKSDVVVENWRTGVAERLGVGFEHLRRVNPRIVLVSMPGYAATGSDADRPGYGLLVESMAGLVSLQGYDGGPPHKSGISYGDPQAGVAAAGSAAMGLMHRERTGQGVHITVSQRDMIIAMAGEAFVAHDLGAGIERRGNRHASHSPHGLFPGRISGRHIGGDGKDGWIAIDVETDETWARFRSVVGDPRLGGAELECAAGRLARALEICEVIAEWTRPRDVVATATLLQRAGIIACPVMSPLMLRHDAHLRARGFFGRWRREDLGEVLCTAPLWRLASRARVRCRHAPRYAEHTARVLRRVLRIGPAAFDDLLATGVTSTDPAQS